MQKQRFGTQQLIVMALFCALAFASTFVFRIPVVLWLKFDPKDCLLAIGGMLYGPLSAFIMSVVVSLVEMITISDTGLIGMAMNVFSTCLFVLPAAFLYQRRRTLATAILGLAIGVVLTTSGMLLWNWLLVPLYTPTITRSVIVPLLWSAFLPFNVFKTTLNAVLTVLLYKSVVSALRAAKLVPRSESASKRGISASLFLLCLLCLAVLILVLVMWRANQ